MDEQKCWLVQVTKVLSLVFFDKWRQMTVTFNIHKLNCVNHCGTHEARETPEINVWVNKMLAPMKHWTTSVTSFGS